MGNADNTYDQLITAVKEISLLGTSASVLHWDQETYMPPKGTETRGNQVSLLARLAHEQFTHKKTGESPATVEQSDPVPDPASHPAANPPELPPPYHPPPKTPPPPLAEISKTAVMGHHAWI